MFTGWRTNGSIFLSGFIALQNPWTPADYRDAESFERAIYRSVETVHSKGWIESDGKTAVIFPEMVGLYLLSSGERSEEMYKPEAKDLSGWITRGVISRLLTAPWTFLTRVSPEAGWSPLRSLQLKYFSEKAAFMADTYERVMAGVARTYGVTVIGGSTVLPGPYLDSEGRLRVDVSKPLYNVGRVYAPNGALRFLTKKVHPTHEEHQELGLEGGAASELPTFELQGKKTAIVICADSWFPDVYAHLLMRGVERVIVPTHHLSSRTLKWRGYSQAPGLKAPSDVDPLDVGRITEGEAWLKYSLSGRWKKDGIVTWASGAFWTDAIEPEAPIVLKNGKIVETGFGKDRPAYFNWGG
jgi:hypothetical protein